MIVSGSKNMLVALAALTLVVSCGNVKFAAGGSDSAVDSGVDSVGDSGTQSERNIDEPVDVAGGFGLTCIPSDNPQDASKSDFRCAVADAGGQKFIDRPELKLDFLVELRGQMVQVTKLTGSDLGLFMFTVAKSDMSQVKVAANFVNPQDGNKVVGALKKDLPETLPEPPSSQPDTPPDPPSSQPGEANWVDVTTGFVSWDSSNCDQSRSRCTLMDQKSGLWWSSRQAEMHWDDAVEWCEDLTHNGKEDWRLPSRTELAMAHENKIYNAARSNWIPHTEFGSKYFWSGSAGIGVIGDKAWARSLGSQNIGENQHQKHQPNTTVCVRSDVGGWSKYNDQTMLDNSTGLLWAGLNIPLKTFAEAESYCRSGDNSDGFGTGFRGWRLPTIEELNQAYAHGLTVGASDPFPIEQDGWLKKNSAEEHMIVWSLTSSSTRFKVKSLDPGVTAADTYAPNLSAFAICVR